MSSASGKVHGEPFELVSTIARRTHEAASSLAHAGCSWFIYSFLHAMRRRRLDLPLALPREDVL